MLYIFYHNKKGGGAWGESKWKNSFSRHSPSTTLCSAQDWRLNKQRNLDTAPAKELTRERGKQILVTRYGNEQGQMSSHVGSQSQPTSFLSTSSSLIHSSGCLSLDRGIGYKLGVLLPWDPVKPVHHLTVWGFFVKHKLVLFTLLLSVHLKPKLLSEYNSQKVKNIILMKINSGYTVTFYLTH